MYVKYSFTFNSEAKQNSMISMNLNEVYIMPKIIVTGFSPLEDLVRKALEKREKKFKELTIQRMSSNDVLRNPSFITNDDVLICGETIYEVFKDLNIRGQIVPVKVHTNDFIRAIVKARTFGDEVNIINYRKNFLQYKKEELEQIFKLKIHQYCYETKEEAELIIQDLKQKDQTIVIGSGLVVNVAEKNEMKGILWYGESSINEAVNISFNILQSRIEELKSFKQEKYILQNFDDGVVTLTEAGRIANINKRALTLLGLKKSESYPGSHILHIFDKSALTDTLLSKKEIRDKVITFGEKMFLVSTFPIIVNNRFNGSVAILSDAYKLEKNEVKIRKTKYSQKTEAPYTFNDIIGNSGKIRKTIDRAKKFARTNSNILIIGDTGTGKELFAQSIHNKSHRADKPFIAVNCAAVPENLLESEFFGYSDGAFTGAKKGGKQGYFEKAHNGTIFLDEIGELPLSMQAKLLRVIQEKVIMRVGSSSIVPIDVRIISATNVNLFEKVKENQFRKDLYYRLAVLNLFIPTLEERMADLGDIVMAFTVRHFPEFLEEIEIVIDDIVNILSQQRWDGNVRELENTLERMFVYLGPFSEAKNADILEHLHEAIMDNYLFDYSHYREETTFQEAIKEAEIEQIKEALAKTNGNRQKAAELLGISRSTLWRKLNSLEKESS